MTKPIKVWRFDEAPSKYRKLFDQDDADWLALVPKKIYDKEYLGWLDGPHFGCRKVEIKDHRDGEIYVGYHS